MKVKQLRNAIVQKCSSNDITCSDLCSCCHEFCENADSKEILENDSSNKEDNINDEEGENNE